MATKCLYSKDSSKKKNRILLSLLTQDMWHSINLDGTPCIANNDNSNRIEIQVLILHLIPSTFKTFPIRLSLVKLQISQVQLFLQLYNQTFKQPYTFFVLFQTLFTSGDQLPLIIKKTVRQD